MTDGPRLWRHADFGFGGFYDFSSQIIVMPADRAAIREYVAHEATHARIVANSSLGYLQQIFASLVQVGQETENAGLIEHAGQIRRLLNETCIQVHEASAWLVSEFLGAGPASIPRAYRPLVDELRGVFDAWPERPLNRAADTPLGQRRIQLIETLAAYALSPPWVPGLLTESPYYLVEQVGRALTPLEENPTVRFRRLLQTIGRAPYADALQWARAVHCWQFGNDDSRLGPEEPIQTGLEHSGLFRSEFGVGAYAILAARLQAPVSAWPVVPLPFHPNIDPLLQVCVCEVPKQLTEFVVEDPEAMLPTEMNWLIVSTGGETDFEFQAHPQGRFTFSFPAPPGAARHWEAKTGRGRTFLEAWVSKRKAIVADSVGYDYIRNDYRRAPLLQDLPHTVVAKTDLRTLLIRMASQDSGSPKRLRVLAIEAENPGFALLVLFRDAPAPPVVMPCLSDMLPMVGQAAETLGLQGIWDIQVLSGEDTPVIVEAAGISLVAAVSILSKYFDRDAPQHWISPIRLDLRLWRWWRSIWG